MQQSVYEAGDKQHREEHHDASLPMEQSVQRLSIRNPVDTSMHIQPVVATTTGKLVSSNCTDRRVDNLLLTDRAQYINHL